MSIVQNDSRELKISVQLSAISKTDTGQASGQYAVDSQVPDPANLRSLITDNFINNPEVIIGNLLNPIKEFKTSKKVKQLSSVHNAKISDVNTSPSASSCTFAYGGIGEGFHLVFNLLRGPANSQYTDIAKILPPTILKTIPNLTPPDTTSLLDDRQSIKSFIPFIEYKNDTRLVNAKYLSEVALQTNQAYLTTYNIWHLFDFNDNTKLLNNSTNVILYEGPEKVKNKPFIKTIRDGLNGSKVFLDTKGKGKSVTLKRIFPTSYDAIYNSDLNRPILFYPTRIKYNSGGTFTLAKDTAPGKTSKDIFILPERIQAYGNSNCGFHINLSSLNVTDPDSNITLIYENNSPNDNSLYVLSILLTPNSLPIVIVKYKEDGNIKYKEFTQIKAPVFDGKATLGYDIFVHFAGPTLLIGFTPDQSQWNAIYPEKKSTTQGNTTEYIDFSFEKGQSFVKFNATNCSFAFTYSAIVFDNYSCDFKFSSDNETTNNAELLQSSKYIWEKYDSASSKYEHTLPLSSRIRTLFGQDVYLLNTKNHILIELQAPRIIEQTTLDSSNLLRSLINNKFMNSYSNYFNSLPNKDISIFGDWRSNHQPTTFTNYFADYALYLIAKSFSTTTGNVYENYPNENKVKTWHKMITNSTIEGPTWLSIEPDSITTLKDKKDFLYPIFDINKNPLDLRDYVSSINVNYSQANDNASIIIRDCTMTLENLDTSDIGWKILELLEHNILVVTVLAGYDQNNLYNYFEGVINDVSTTRTGTTSKTTLSCSDLGMYILNNLYFDNIHSFATRTLKDCISTVVNASGFGDYYHVEHESEIGFLNLRISSNATTPQDTSSSLATPFDKIGDKLNIFLQKLVQLERQGTFRWEPDSAYTEEKKAGFILDARYSNFNCDTDFQFSGINPVTNTIDAVPASPNSNYNSNPGWHGLLTSEYTIKTNISPISYRVETFGYTNLQGVRTKFDNIPNSIGNVDAIQNSLSNTVVPKGYVGFRKKTMDLINRQQIFDEDGLNLKHAQNVQIVKNPFHTINFGCYITKPLKFHGTFIIKVFSDPKNVNQYEVTDKYIYQSLSYTIDKNQNLITAQVSGMRQPWTIRELKEENE